MDQKIIRGVVYHHRHKTDNTCLPLDEEVLSQNVSEVKVKVKVKVNSRFLLKKRGIFLKFFREKAFLPVDNSPKKGQKRAIVTPCFPGTIFLPNSTQILIKFYLNSTIEKYNKNFVRI